MRLRLLIADDEKPARNKIRTFLRDQENIDIILEAKNGVECVEQIRTQHPDIVFLDIQMPGLSGFDVIEAVGSDRMPVVVLVTAYDEFALEAFEVRAVDYLLKPYDQDRFQQAYHRALTWLDRKTENKALLNGLISDIILKNTPIKRILVNLESRYFFIQVEDILYITAEEKYVNLHTLHENYLLRKKMTHLETRLDPAKFVRIHRSTMINVDCIQEMQPRSHGDYTAIMKNGDRLTISRRYRDRLFNAVG